MPIPLANRRRLRPPHLLSICGFQRRLWEGSAMLYSYMARDHTAKSHTHTHTHGFSHGKNTTKGNVFCGFVKLLIYFYLERNL